VSEDITELLGAWSDGDASAADELLRRVSGRLRRLAGSFLARERRDHTLQTTELIHEAYLRLVRQENVSWEDREHFFTLTGRMMRRILVDHARRRAYLKHGGAMERVDAEILDRAVVDPDRQLVEIDEALEALGAETRELAVVVELRYFVGLTGDEIAATLGVSRPTVQRRWRAARAWLHRYLSTGGDTAAVPEASS
ncbi:MAG: ECF-type sigma factor, partial [Acidobacteriota bacterium]